MAPDTTRDLVLDRLTMQLGEVLELRRQAESRSRAITERIQRLIADVDKAAREAE